MCASIFKKHIYTRVLIIFSQFPIRQLIAMIITRRRQVLWYEKVRYDTPGL